MVKHDAVELVTSAALKKRIMEKIDVTTLHDNVFTTIACSSLSRSEIVVPLKHNGVVVGEIDIDSTELATFDDVDRQFLEHAAEVIAPYMAKLAIPL